MSSLLPHGDIPLVGRNPSVHTWYVEELSFVWDKVTLAYHGGPVPGNISAGEIRWAVAVRLFIDIRIRYHRTV